MKQKFNVTGMTCSACSAHVEKAVSRLDGVQKAEVSLMTNSMTVQYDEDVLSPGGIIDAVVHAGYGASLPEAAAVKTAAARPEARMEEELSAMKHRLVWSFVFLIPLFYISMGHMMGAPLPEFLLGMENAVAFGLTQLLLTLPIMYLNDKYYKVGFKTLLHRAPNMDSLIAVGSAAAVVYGVFAIYQMGYGLGHGDLELTARYHMDLYFESAGMILTLITLGKFLETRSKGKTSQAITRLMDLAPKTAAVLRNGQEVEIPVEEVRVGDRIVVRPGQSIPVDGVIVEGSSAVDESALTGESLPVDKGPGDKVAAAAINRSGSFTFEASRVGEDTTLAQMIRLVEEAGLQNSFCLEVTEEAALERFGKIAENLHELFRHGILAAIDDFSMGQTSLKYLQGSNFQFVKLDGTLVRQLLDSPRSQDIVRAIVGLGEDLSFQVVAEYVESRELRDLLLSLNCRIFQGYLYSPAVPPAGLVRFVQDQDSAG